MNKKIRVFVLLAVLFVFSFSFFSSTFAKENENKLTIISENAQRNAILGFKYQVKNIDTNEVKIIDLTKKSKEELSLKNGNYLISQTQRPKGFKEEKDVRISFPYKLEDSTYTREVKVFTKHIIANTTNPETGDRGIALFGAMAIISTIGLGIILIRNKFKA